MQQWKHLSGDDPAGYNAQDSDALVRNAYGIMKDLKANNQWPIFYRHVVELDRALKYMSSQGVGLDMKMRAEAEEKLQDLLDVAEMGMEATIPDEVRKYKVYKRTPANVDGMVEIRERDIVARCGRCGLVSPTKPHFKVFKKKENPCGGAEKVGNEEDVLRWARPLPFKVSKQSLSTYQKALRHQAILSRKDRKITFDENAIIKLIKKYPNDPLYPIILQFREYQKLLSTYIGVTQEDGTIRGGMPLGDDRRVHTSFTHNPSTLRLASQQPNLQNLPRPGREDDLQTIIRNLVIADDGYVFYARDYSGIEAVLVGYFALAPHYIRLAKIDVHSFYTAYALNALDGRVQSADLPQLSWSDERLREHLAGIKKEFKHDRNTLYKHLVHGANFYQGARGAQEKILKETGHEYPVKIISKVMGVYFELFPEIRKWHSSLWLQAAKDGYVRNPFGYVHRFNKVYDYEKIGGKWEKKPGPDANKVVAFLPQSTASGIIKEATYRLYFKRFEEAGQWLRLQVHDEIFSEVPEERLDAVDAVNKEEMERPIPELMLPASYGMGPLLSVDTESKVGTRWGSMR
jgi:DNA polymerase I-like protein with 3'-5' exonuclease and polymerase domains